MWDNTSVSEPLNSNTNAKTEFSLGAPKTVYDMTQTDMDLVLT